MARPGAGSLGSRNISSAPPERQGLTTVKEPSLSGKSSDPSGRMRSSSEAPDSSRGTAASRTDPSAHCPPTNPSIEPSAKTIAESPGLAEVGHCARTTVAETNGVPALINSAERVARLTGVRIGDQIGGVWLPCMVSHTREGVSGMSAWRMPYGFKASTIAFTIAGGEPTVADSPMPLAPMG